MAWKNAKKEIPVDVFPNDSLNNLLFVPSVSTDAFVEHLQKYNTEMWTSQAVLEESWHRESRRMGEQNGGQRDNDRVNGKHLPSQIFIIFKIFTV